MTADYVTVLRAPSAALLLRDQGFEINLADPPSRVRSDLDGGTRALSIPFQMNCGSR